MGVEWYLVVLICIISVMTNDEKHVFISFLTICVSSLRNVYSTLCLCNLMAVAELGLSLLGQERDRQLAERGGSCVDSRSHVRSLLAVWSLGCWVLTVMMLFEFPPN